ncbi:MAG: epimerase [Bacteroidetes bacterium GWE2_29_8]|nr:MAG: epimerase [Bacteroidetes bacterium GWE2_29_8]
MKNILITGGAGFIGSTLADKLIDLNDCYVVIVDDLSTGFYNNLPLKHPTNKWKFIKCDINKYKDIAEIMLSFKFDYVFHYAAVVGVQRTQEYPVKVLKDLHGIENLLNLSKNTTVKRIFYASSSEVYGEPVELPQHELTTPLNSRLPYAIVKNAGEAFLKSYHKEFGLEYTVFRFFNTYGPRQTEDFVISKFIRNALSNKDIKIYGDGSQTRTFCYIMDNINATINSINDDKSINSTINIGSDNEITIKYLAEIIIELTKSKSEINYINPLPEGDMTRRQPEISKMRDLLDSELIDIKTGLKMTIDWFKQNEK